MALLLGLPGVVALVGYSYVTTPATAVPAGLSLPLLALVSAVNPLLFLGIACLLGAYTAPRVGLRSHVIDRTGGGSGVWQRLRNDVGLAIGIGIGIVGGVLIIVLDVVMMPLVAQDLPQSVI